MLEVDEELQTKVKKTNNLKCALCSLYIRKDSGRNKVIESRDAAKQMRDIYKIYVQAGKVICFKCFARLRMQKFQSKPTPSTSRTIISETDDQEVKTIFTDSASQPSTFESDSRLSSQSTIADLTETSTESSQQPCSEELSFMLNDST